MSPRVLGYSIGLAAALLFGASAPMAKRLLAGAEPLALAAVLYVGAGAALTLIGVLRRGAEPPLRGRDLPALSVILVLGGLVGPALMLWGLNRLSGVAGALLLNLEAPFTMLLAMAAFREHLGRRELAAAALIVLGGAALAQRPGELRGDWLGVLAIAGACAAWALDNNLTQRLSLRDPLAVARAKTLGAGAGMAAIAALAGQRFPTAGALAVALGVGALSYGVSIVLDAYALRFLGAAREAAVFATAPFAGALLAIPLCRERPGAVDAAAAAVMVAGVALLLRARHGHRHHHDAVEHEHLHVHDEHHQHAHDAPIAEPHSHLHRHQPLVHEHPHVSDAHHRHRHRE